ncbi:MAG: succinylglutamate desuccinylase/aspartoacylase family protein [Candidatus Thermoplasmatota archaeon]|nr:succinylglutamate desuccinylase/aspartoacylase family protein [Candidatus Thermoplasmatota archaeon]
MSVKVSKKKIRIGERADGSAYVLSILEYKGSAGPSVFIGAGVHGDELTGIASIWRLIDYLKGKEVLGTITIIPSMNPDGLNYNIRGMPEAGVDLNRLYPGKSTGYIAERITAKIWEIARKHDVIVDLHTIGRGIPFVLLDPVSGDLKRRNDELAEATGITVLDEFESEDYAQQNLGSSLGGVASTHGIASLTIELGGSKDIDWGTVEAGYLAVRNVLVHLGAVKGTLTPVKSSVVIHEKGYRREDVWSEKGGLLEYVVELGQKVKAGQVIAKVRSPFGEVVEEIRMPEDGYMVALNSYENAYTGGAIATIAIKVRK